MNKVSILKRDGFVDGPYSTYSAASSAADSGDLIQIWVSLNEQIILKDKVDIWIAPGVVLNNLSGSLSSSFITVTDNGNMCICKIYGMGIIKSTFEGSTGTVYECIKTTHADTELEIECDYIEGSPFSQSYPPLIRFKNLL